MKVIFLIFLLLTGIISGPVAFTTCLQGLGVYLGGAGAAIGGCAACGFPPLVLGCIAGVLGVPGLGYLGICTSALFAPTP
jgi:hypothetical protein